MKRFLITLSILLTGFYFAQAINLNLSSRNKLNVSNWQEINNITTKTSLSSNDLNINGKLVSNSKICSGNSCIGECEENYYWDSSSGTCLANPGSETAPASSCLDLYNKSERENKAYYLTGTSGKTYKVYCDMTTGLGGRTLVAKAGNAHTDNVFSTFAAPTSETDLSNFSNKDLVGTTNGTLMNEFKPISTKIRFEFPNGDNAFLLSKLVHDTSSSIGNDYNSYPTGDVENISGYMTRRTKIKISNSQGCGIISYNDGDVRVTNYGIRYRGTNDLRKSSTTGPAYVYLR